MTLCGAMPENGICAHRGDRAEYPENTVPAFLSAVKKGAAMVEFDVHRCKTGELIVMHDDTIDRTTTGKGRWRDLSFEYLRSVDAGIKRGEKFAGVKIPTFDEAIDCFPTNGVWLNVHCDDSVTDEVALKLKAKGRIHQAFIAAFAPGVKKARAVVPEIKTCLFAMPKDSWKHSWTAEERRASIAEVMALKCEFTQPHNADFTQDELYAYHANGGKVNFFWCNKPSRLPSLLARGIDFPLTDNLAPMVAAHRACQKSKWSPPDPERGFDYMSDSGFVCGRLAPIDRPHCRHSRHFGGIPSIAVSKKNGRLWCTWYAGPSNGEDSNNFLVLATCASGGEWKEVGYYDPDGDGPIRSFDPELWISPDGVLHWTWTERKVALREVGEEERWGKTIEMWSEKLMSIKLNAEDEPPVPGPVPRVLHNGGVMMCKPIVTKGGRLLYPLSYWRDDFSARLYESLDGGNTLVPLGGVTLPELHREFDEHNVVELKDGTLRTYIRVRGNKAWNAWQADSHDGGRTWEKAKPCPFPHTNSRFFVRRLQSGALLLVKNGPLEADVRAKDYVGRNDMTAYVSDDDGATWKGGLLLHRGYCAYPDGDQAADGTIYITFDGDRFAKQEIFHMKFTEDDVRKGGELH